MEYIPGYIGVWANGSWENDHKVQKKMTRNTDKKLHLVANLRIGPGPGVGFFAGKRKEIKNVKALLKSLSFPSLNVVGNTF